MLIFFGASFPLGKASSSWLPFCFGVFVPHLNLLGSYNFIEPNVFLINSRKCISVIKSALDLFPHPFYFILDWLCLFESPVNERGNAAH